MRKMTALLLCITVLFCICGCRQEEPVLISPVSFYYRTAEMTYDGTSAVIIAEQRESAGYDGNMQLLLNVYFNGPTTHGLTSPFPRALKAINYSVFGATALVQVSSEISQLTGIDLSIACACIASTVFEQNENLERVQISSTGSYLDGSNSVTFSRGELLLLDTDALPAPTVESVPDSSTP